MIKAFQALLAEKRLEIDTLKMKYQNGYETLIKTEEKVNDMKQELIDMQPVLIATAKEVAEQTLVVQEKTNAAEIVKQGVAKEEAVA
jgi:dynein heavy chain